MSGPLIDDRTETLGLPLPHPQNHAADDCLRLRESLQKMDAAAKLLDAAVTENALTASNSDKALDTKISEAKKAADDAQTAADAKVALTGNETIAGVKTFSSTPKAPAPAAESNDTSLAPTVWIRDMLRLEVEALSGGRNTVVRDVKNNPHIMVVIPRFNLQDIDASLGTGTHPAFIVNGVTKSEILVGKYLASKGSGDWVQTLSHKFPWVLIDFDTSLAKCRALGPNFGLCTHAMRSARALWLWKNFGEHYYCGNTNYGRDYVNHWQTGTLNYTDMIPGDSGAWNAGKHSYNATGSGPVEWNDDETPHGISDATGSVWEWSAGLRIVNAEIQVIPNNDAMLKTCDMSADSSEWKAILGSNGSLVSPGTSGTLKWDADRAQTKTSNQDGAPRLNTVIANPTRGAWQFCELKALTAASGVTAPATARALGFWPMDNKVQGGLWTYNGGGERLALAGGDWANGATCGPFALNLNYGRTYAGRNVGFRPAYVS